LAYLLLNFANHTERYNLEKIFFLLKSSALIILQSFGQPNNNPNQSINPKHFISSVELDNHIAPILKQYDILDAQIKQIRENHYILNRDCAKAALADAKLFRHQAKALLLKELDKFPETPLTNSYKQAANNLPG